jgi:ferredoxin-thioredoxin reductase catalytic subunit
MKNITLNTDLEFVKKIKGDILINGGYCPCSIIKNKDTKCPCKKFREEQECCCGLYIKVNN